MCPSDVLVQRTISRDKECNLSISSKKNLFENSKYYLVRTTIYSRILDDEPNKLVNFLKFGYEIYGKTYSIRSAVCE